MDTEYQQFQLPATSSFSFQPNGNLLTGKTRVWPGGGVLELLWESGLAVCAGAKRAMGYVPYGLLLLLLFILLLLTGIKCKSWSKRQTCCFTSPLFSCSTNTFSLFHSRRVTQRRPSYQSSHGEDGPRVGNLHRRYRFHKSACCWLGFSPSEMNSFILYLCCLGLRLNCTTNLMFGSSYRGRSKQ